jgi:CheY-like chemotaxis protein
MPKLLCIDDYQAGLEIRKTMLHSHGCDVLTATSGVAGLKLLEEQAVDAVILDYRMEGMDGEAVARAIRSKNPRLPIVLLTGCPHDIPERLLAMVDAYVVKGEPSQRLLDAIETVTGLKLEHTGQRVLREEMRQRIKRAKSVMATAQAAGLRKRPKATGI